MARGGKYAGKRRGGGAWFDHFVDVVRFIGIARTAFPGLRVRTTAEGLEFRVQVALERYEPRTVRVTFRRTSPRYPRVTTDGPTESRHRNRDGTLCLWYPDDGAERRWVFEDGLPQLLAIVTLHLFKQAHWRRTGGHEGGEWLGDEVHDEQPKSSEPPEGKDAG
jgi:hypothetical protein